jgi:hypothetical protein
MTSPRCIPIFDGHNDVLSRLYRRGGTNAAPYLALLRNVNARLPYPDDIYAPRER